MVLIGMPNRVTKIVVHIGSRHASLTTVHYITKPQQNLEMTIFVQRIEKLLWGLFIWTNNFCFLSIALFLLFHVVLSLWWVEVVVPSDYLVSTQLQLCSAPTLGF